MRRILVLYLVYSLFTGRISLAFSVLLRMELSSPGSQYLAGNHHLCNVVVTTHGIVMIYFLVVPTYPWPVLKLTAVALLT